jgi:hypothetical protein
VTLLYQDSFVYTRKFEYLLFDTLKIHLRLRIGLQFKKAEKVLTDVPFHRTKIDIFERFILIQL